MDSLSRKSFQQLGEADMDRVFIAFQECPLVKEMSYGLSCHTNSYIVLPSMISFTQQNFTRCQKHWYVK